MFILFSTLILDNLVSIWFSLFISSDTKALFSPADFIFSETLLLSCIKLTVSFTSLLPIFKPSDILTACLALLKLFLIFSLSNF